MENERRKTRRNQMAIATQLIGEDLGAICDELKAIRKALENINETLNKLTIATDVAPPM